MVKIYNSHGSEAKKLETDYKQGKAELNEKLFNQQRASRHSKNRAAETIQQRKGYAEGEAKLDAKLKPRADKLDKYETPKKFSVARPKEVGKPVIKGEGSHGTSTDYDFEEKD